MRLRYCILISLKDHCYGNNIDSSGHENENEIDPAIHHTQRDNTTSSGIEQVGHWMSNEHW